MRRRRNAKPVGGVLYDDLRLELDMTAVTPPLNLIRFRAFAEIVDFP